MAGDLAGLRQAGEPSLPATLPLFLAVATVLATAPLLRHRRSFTALLAATAGAAGFALGAAAGRRSLAACPRELEAGERVEVRGTAVRDLPARSPRSSRSGPRASGRRRSGTLRLELRSVTLAAEEGTCRIPSLRARVAPPEEAVRAGTTVRVHGEWRPASRGRWPRPPARYGWLRGRVAAPDPGPPPPAVSRGVLRLRAAASRRLAARVPDDVEAAARALVLAERDDLDPGLARRFADAGLAHLLAISGLHVGLLAAGVTGLLGLCTRRRGRFLAAALVTAGYVALIGAPPSALRAAVLVAGWSVARARGSPVRGTELLGLAAVVAVLLDPLAPTGPGFQLSFAGCAGLLVGGGLGRRLTSEGAGAGCGRRPRRVADRAVRAVAAGVGAVAFTAPFAALHFQRVAPVAVLSNFVGVPLVGLALGGLFGALALPGPAGELAGEGAGQALRILFRSVDALGGLPMGHGAVARPGPVYWGVAVLLGAAAVTLARGSRPARAALPVALAAALWLAGPVLGRGPWRDRSLLCSLDVGQGDAAALRTRRGHWAVFDAGPRRGRRDAGWRVVVPFLRREGATGVELFVLSHSDGDHLGGAEALFSAFPVGRVLDAGNPVGREAYAAFLDRVAEEGADWLPARPGDRVRLDEVEVLVLGPRPPSPSGAGPADDGRARPRDPNAASVTVRVRLAPGVTYLNPGDLPAAGELALLRRWPADSLRAILMKAAHHGSRTSTTPAWIRAVRPAIVVISAGAGNRYGHPHPEVLRRLREAGVPRIWRTDRRGTLCLEVRADGRWRVRGEEGWHRGAPAAADAAATPDTPRRPPWSDPSSR